MESIAATIEAVETDEKQRAEDEAAFHALWAIAAPGVTYEQIIGVIAATRGGYLPGLPGNPF